MASIIETLPDGLFMPPHGIRLVLTHELPESKCITFEAGKPIREEPAVRREEIEAEAITIKDGQVVAWWSLFGKMDIGEGVVVESWQTLESFDILVECINCEREFMVQRRATSRAEAESDAIPAWCPMCMRQESW